MEIEYIKENTKNVFVRFKDDYNSFFLICDRNIIFKDREGVKNFIQDVYTNDTVPKNKYFFVGDEEDLYNIKLEEIVRIEKFSQSSNNVHPIDTKWLSKIGKRGHDKESICTIMVEMFNDSLELYEKHLDEELKNRMEESSIDYIQNNEYFDEDTRVPISRNDEFFSMNKNDEKMFYNFVRIENGAIVFNDGDTKEVVPEKDGKVLLKSGLDMKLDNIIETNIKPMLQKANKELNRYFLEKTTFDGTDYTTEELKKILVKILPSFILNNCEVVITYKVREEEDSNGKKIKTKTFSKCELYNVLDRKNRGKFDIIDSIGPYIKNHINHYITRQGEIYSNNNEDALHYVPLNVEENDGSTKVNVPECIDKTFGVRTSTLDLHYIGAFLWKCMNKDLSGRQTLILFNKGNCGTSTYIDLVNKMTDNSISAMEESLWLKDPYCLQKCISKRLIAIKDVTRTKELFEDNKWRSLTSGETIPANIKFGEAIEYGSKNIQIIVSTNKKVYANDDYQMTRILPVLFDIDDKVEKKDANVILDYIMSNRDSVVQWAYDCYRRLDYLGLVNGNSDFFIITNDLFTNLNENNEHLSDEDLGKATSYKYMATFDNKYLQLGRLDEYDEAKEDVEDLIVRYILNKCDDIKICTHKNDSENFICLQKFPMILGNINTEETLDDNSTLMIRTIRSYLSWNDKSPIPNSNKELLKLWDLIKKFFKNLDIKQSKVRIGEKTYNGYTFKRGLVKFNDFDKDAKKVTTNYPMNPEQSLLEEEEYESKVRQLDAEIESSGMFMDKFGHFRSKTYSDNFT